jgi:hypothetical protein
MDLPPRADREDRVVSDEALLLQEKFAELLRWERAKLRETILLRAVGISLLVSLALLPARGLLPDSFTSIYLPIVLFLLVAPAGFLLRPWGPRESRLALFNLDRTLRLEERALTAAEILTRGAPSAVERYVLSETGERLKDLDIKAAFKRRWSWQALAAAPLLLVWLALVWLDVGSVDFRTAGSRPAALAEKLKEFSEELRSKAERQELAESLKIARALKELAEERLKGQGSDQKLGENLAAIKKQLGRKVHEGESGARLGDYHRDALASLKAELDVMKGQLGRGSTIKESELFEQLSALPRLSEAMEQGRAPGGKAGGEGLKNFLDRLGRDVAGEMDRRSLADVENFLALLLQGNQAGELPTESISAGGREGESRSPESEKAGGRGELAGNQPGSLAGSAESPQPGANAISRLQGILREGKSSGFTLRGEAKAGPSKIPEEEIAASYRRQVEEDLASEKIPREMKEAVKKYFLSLGMEEKK